jgi:hypothetical protein
VHPATLHLWHCHEVIAENGSLTGNQEEKNNLTALYRPRNRGATFLTGLTQTGQIHDVPAHLQVQLFFQILDYTAQSARPEVYEAVAGFTMEPVPMNRCS